MVSGHTDNGISMKEIFHFHKMEPTDFNLQFEKLAADLSEQVVHGVAGCLVVVAEDPEQPQNAYLSGEATTRNSNFNAKFHSGVTVSCGVGGGAKRLQGCGRPTCRKGSLTPDTSCSGE